MTSAAAEPLVMEIVDTLEEHGLARDAYQLGTEFDPEALERLLESASSEVAVRLEVQGIPLLVTPTETRVVGDE
ncbi:hypothetical protein [Halostagnicola kamekurae]|uniref:Halobacterial output domain-containing protein n=1 Tax=Halostagnicola kamekurae TaxID=619731 RepID=A0A1I6QNU7_9EURY|nr:hypothetical protein [Halostagnicola kamekurae]SFS54012.1 hypothetical protein SAMN04488556_1401 [Halostagnicola kamekurae]